LVTNIEKCTFAVSRVEFLSQKISSEDDKPLPDMWRQFCSTPVIQLKAAAGFPGVAAKLL
jgi:hypothetical protein